MSETRDPSAQKSRAKPHPHRGRGHAVQFSPLIHIAHYPGKSRRAVSGQLQRHTVMARYAGAAVASPRAPLLRTASPANPPSALCPRRIGAPFLLGRTIASPPLRDMDRATGSALSVRPSVSLRRPGRRSTPARRRGHPPGPPRPPYPAMSPPGEGMNSPGASRPPNPRLDRKAPTPAPTGQAPSRRPRLMPEVNA